MQNQELFYPSPFIFLFFAEKSFHKFELDGQSGGVYIFAKHQRRENRPAILFRLPLRCPICKLQNFSSARAQKIANFSLQPGRGLY